MVVPELVSSSGLHGRVISVHFRLTHLIQSGVHCEDEEEAGEGVALGGAPRALDRSYSAAIRVLDDGQ